MPGESSRHDQNNEPKRGTTNQSIYMSSHEPEGGGDCKLSHESENDSVSDEEEDVRTGESSRPSPDCKPEGGSVDYGNLESCREPEGGTDCKLNHKSKDDSVSNKEENVWPGESAEPSPDCEPEGGSVDYGNLTRSCEPEGGNDSKLHSKSGEGDVSSEEAGVWEDPKSHDSDSSDSKWLGNPDFSGFSSYSHTDWPDESYRPRLDCEPKGGSVEYGNKMMRKPEGGSTDYYGPIPVYEPDGGSGGVITIEYNPEGDDFDGYRCVPCGDEGGWGPPRSYDCGSSGFDWLDVLKDSEDVGQPQELRNQPRDASKRARGEGALLHTGMCQVRCREREEHPVSGCPVYLSLDLDGRWGIVLKR
jgi:hypothetical protein